jgi:quinol monooxygenase YgiN
MIVVNAIIESTEHAIAALKAHFTVPHMAQFQEGIACAPA